MNAKIAITMAGIVAAVSFCTPGKKIEMRVSKTHQETFAHLSNPSYSGASIGKVLGNLEKDGNALCKALVAGKKPPRKIFNKSLAKERRKELIENWEKDLQDGVFLGCKNWYKLTDQNPGRDFGMVKERIAADGTIKFDCYAVGFMQPYIMAASMNCTRLNIVDINYRTIKLHYELITAMGKKKPEDAEAKIKGMSLYYPADSSKPGKMKKSVKLSLKKLCGKENYAQCAASLAAFPAKLQYIEEVRFHLAPLEEVSFSETIIEGARPIAYLSNAIDPAFMKKKEMKQLVDNFASLSVADAPGVFIYHQSGEEDLGIYLVDKQSEVSVSCSDKFVALRKTTKKNFCGITSTSIKKEKYTTYLDQFAGLTEKQKKGKKLCSSDKK